MPDPFRTREDLLKKKKKKKKKEGAACHLRISLRKRTKNLRYTSDSLTVNWGGEKASPSSLS